MRNNLKGKKKQQQQESESSSIIAAQWGSYSKWIGQRIDNQFKVQQVYSAGVTTG